MLLLRQTEPEVLAPKLQAVDGAVIIRRGDTLWRISKRVYGRGVRYSTIYLANQEQIRDPDRIWPGQVFSVPDKSKEGETGRHEAARRAGGEDRALQRLISLRYRARPVAAPDFIVYRR